jgi:hypothetical protein
MSKVPHNHALHKIDGRFFGYELPGWLGKSSYAISHVDRACCDVPVFMSVPDCNLNWNYVAHELIPFCVKAIARTGSISLLVRVVQRLKEHAKPGGDQPAQLMASDFLAGRSIS